MESQQSKPATERKIPGTEVPAAAAGIAGDGGESPAQRRWLSRVGVTTAVLAACASVATMFSASYLNKAMLDQIEASDNWNYYQAKGIKLAVLEGRLELQKALQRSETIPAKRENDESRAARYRQEQEEIRTAAESRQQLATEHQSRHSRLALASTGFQIAIALAAVALLTRKNGFWLLSVLVGLVGVVVMAWGLFA